MVNCLMKFCLLAASVFILLGCSEKMFIPGADFEQKNLPFLKDNITHRDDFILHLGEPSWSFEEGRILTYRIAIDKKGNLNPIRVTGNKSDPYFSYMTSISTRYYSLVLIFGTNHILEKHSLLLTNP